MAPLDPPAPTEDELLARRLSDFFATVNGRPTPEPSAAPAPADAGAEPAPPPPSTAPAPLRRPEAPSFEAPAGEPQPTVDMVKLMKYLDAQLELTRQEAREGVKAVLAAIAALDERLTEVDGKVGEAATTAADFREELFDWLEGYSGWEVNEVAELRARLTEVRDVLIPAAVPDPPGAPEARRPRFGG